MVDASLLMVMRSEWLDVVEACGGLCDGGIGQKSLKVVYGGREWCVVCGVVWCKGFWWCWLLYPCEWCAVVL